MVSKPHVTSVENYLSHNLRKDFRESTVSYTKDKFESSAVFQP